MPDDYQQDLEKRMRGPQRHRLLQGYPQPSLMEPRAFHSLDWLLEYYQNWPRPLLVGVLPHAACNPSVRGCGYCTFPHEDFRLSEVRDTVNAVVKEIRETPFQGNAEALYFGGGTANLTPPDLFKTLCDALNQRFTFQDAEVTLEGAPVYFTHQKEALLESLVNEFPASTHRISMGVQTFERARIHDMGRQHIGSPEAVEKAVKAAQRRNILTSADLMVNMPGQSPEQMKEDVLRASDLGLSQLSIYHLVLFRGLGVPWATDPDKLNALPDNEEAVDNWLQVRELALTLGYRQTTLTNFQREGQFRYEDCSYQPQTYDWVGYGPDALSCFTDRDWNYTVKWLNCSSGADYRKTMQNSTEAIAHYFLYTPLDMGLLYLTRGFARLEVSAKTYREHCDRDMLADFALAWEALGNAGLVVIEDDAVRLTERGMFFADSVVGLLAAERVKEIRRGVVLEEPPIFRMG